MNNHCDAHRELKRGVLKRRRKGPARGVGGNARRDGAREVPREACGVWPPAQRPAPAEARKVRLRVRRQKKCAEKITMLDVHFFDE
jgi:hypothetical protein